MKLISWNVNGIRAALNKGFAKFLETESPDLICLQETKAEKSQVPVDFTNYIEIWNSAVRKGYSGTAIFLKNQPITTWNGMLKHDAEIKDDYGDSATEGRVLTVELDKFYFVTVYTPNSKPDLSRLEFRHKVWDPTFLKYVKELEEKKPVIFAGDLNVAHKEIDLARPDQNHKNAGFTDEEREGFDNIVNAGFIDTFRQFNQEGNNYTWWSNFGGARARNVGWRIDYFCASEKLKNNLVSANIMPSVMGSDHCPVTLEVEF
jgi:exodeoxyribonuclease-3